MPAPRALFPALLACSLLGVFGTVSGFLGILSWDQPLRPLELAPLPERPADVGEAAWKRIEDTYARLPEVQVGVVRRHRAALDALAVVNLVSSAALLVGAQLARRRAPAGLNALRTGLGLSEAYAAISLYVNTRVQTEILEGLRPQLELLRELPGMPAQLATTLQAAQVLSAALLAGQLAFYVWMHWWTARPTVAPHVAPDPRA